MSEERMSLEEFAKCTFGFKKWCKDFEFDEDDVEIFEFYLSYCDLTDEDALATIANDYFERFPTKVCTTVPT